MGGSRHINLAAITSGDAPGLPDEAALRLACSSVAKPLNYVAGIGPARFTVAELKEIGVRRVTIGTSFCRAALSAVVRAAREVLDSGSFSYLDGVQSVAEFNELIDPRTVFLSWRQPTEAEIRRGHEIAERFGLLV